MRRKPGLIEQDASKYLPMNEIVSRCHRIAEHRCRFPGRARLKSVDVPTWLDTTSLVHESYLRFLSAGHLQVGACSFPGIRDPHWRSPDDLTVFLFAADVVVAHLPGCGRHVAPGEIDVGGL